MRIGTGYDVHRLVPDRELVLGGVRIAYEKGLLGHSDADVLVHAVMDALLGAAALGDIGRHFPDSDEQYRGASSLKLLKDVGDLLSQEHYLVGNIDATIIAQHPKLAEYLPTMGENIASVLGIEKNQVNIKATTEEGLGFTGAGEGIAAQAVALLVSAGDFMEGGNAGLVYAYDGNMRDRGCAGGKCGYCGKV
ncbi:MAG: 2-C-methyl-D-erythritol 2,4-cyclodiphosphate synthase [Lachnospiraceae bacterium]|nr:2-C-methyl-D-erythritol 2,4-cyclodiphosphate synthase [Lachnospiraceae bacterium]